MSILVGFSFYGIGLVCIALGIMWAVQRKARVFYGIHIHGPAAVIAGGIIGSIGVCVIGFAYFILPRLLGDLLELQ